MSSLWLLAVLGEGRQVVRVLSHGISGSITEKEYTGR